MGGSLHAVSVSVPVQIFDLNGVLLAEVVAMTTSCAAAPSDADVLELILQGRDLPGFGPTSVPSLARLDVGRPTAAVAEAPAVATAPADDAPSGSALSTLDAVALFGDVAQRQFARS